MLQKDCQHDCNQGNCPFAQDTRNPNRYVCLKCGVEREINKSFSGVGSFLMLLFSLFIAFQVLANSEQQHNQQKEQETVFESSSGLIVSQP